MTKTAKLIIGTTATVAVTAGVAFALYLLFRTEETHTTTVESKKEAGILICQAMVAVDGGFFDIGSAHSVEQKVKITFVENVPDKLNYLYDGAYASAEAASRANDILHADYNYYMGTEAEKLTPTFSVIDDTLKINLFAGRNQINAEVGRLFFLTSEEVAKFDSYKDKDLMKLYQNKGFSCELEIK